MKGIFLSVHHVRDYRAGPEWTKKIVIPCLCALIPFDLYTNARMLTHDLFAVVNLLVPISGLCDFGRELLQLSKHNGSLYVNNTDI